MEFSNAFVITGSIATGKSSVCTILKEKGYDIIDADKIAHKLLDENANDISMMFGDSYVIDGKVDRKALGGLIFSDKLSRQKLEGLLHPKIKDEILRQAKELDVLGKVFFIDIPLYFETKNYDFENVVLVYATRGLQCQRLMLRDDLDTKAAQNKIELQIDIEQKKEMSKFIIDNSFGYDNLICEIDKFLTRIKR